MQYPGNRRSLPIQKRQIQERKFNKKNSNYSSEQYKPCHGLGSSHYFSNAPTDRVTTWVTFSEPPPRNGQAKWEN